MNEKKKQNYTHNKKKYTHDKTSKQWLNNGKKTNNIFNMSETFTTDALRWRLNNDSRITHTHRHKEKHTHTQPLSNYEVINSKKKKKMKYEREECKETTKITILNWKSNKNNVYLIIITYIWKLNKNSYKKLTFL